MNNPLEWTSNEFFTFVLIHAAQADLEITDPERKYISNKHGEELCREMEAFYFELGEYERLEYILKCRSKYFATDLSKQEVLDEMKEMFHADGDFSKLEKNLLLFFEKLL